jgi:hypothetical protein
MTIAFTGRLAITNSGSNAHVFHYVTDSKLRLGLPGFGEAGLRFAKDLSQAALTDIVALGRA